MSPDTKRLSALVEACRDRLAECSDSVRIFVTAQTQDGESNTALITEGGGNLAAQLGQVESWLEYQKELVREEARKDAKA